MRLKENIDIIYIEDNWCETFNKKNVKKVSHFLFVNKNLCFLPKYL